jgi:hypothetical protein
MEVELAQQRKKLKNKGKEERGKGQMVYMTKEGGR